MMPSLQSIVGAWEICTSAVVGAQALWQSVRLRRQSLCSCALERWMHVGLKVDASTEAHGVLYRTS